MLFQCFAHLGADPKALDASRVLRLVGSTSGRTGDVVRVVRIARTVTMGGTLRDGCVVYPFDELTRTLLPLTREELAERRAAWQAELDDADLQVPVKPSTRKGKERAQTLAPAECKALTGRWNLKLIPSQLAWDRLHDLRTLVSIRGWEQGAPAGARNMLVFLAGCFLAHIGYLKHFDAELREFARQVAPNWTETEIRSCTTSVVSRMERARAGGAVEFKGALVDPRYRFSNVRLVEWLEVSTDEQRKLATIIGRDEALRRDRERKERQRRQEGRMTRAAYTERSSLRVAQAQSLAAGGMCLQGIATKMGVSVSSVRGYLRR